MEVIRKQLADGVYLTCLPARKFKTSLLSAQFVTPLTEKNAAVYALLPAVLRRGTVRYPDMGSLSAELDRLYGAEIDYTVRKKAENQSLFAIFKFLFDSLFVEQIVSIDFLQEIEQIFPFRVRNVRCVKISPYFRQRIIWQIRYKLVQNTAHGKLSIRRKF